MNYHNVTLGDYVHNFLLINRIYFFELLLKINPNY